MRSPAEKRSQLELLAKTLLFLKTSMQVFARFESETCGNLTRFQTRYSGHPPFGQQAIHWSILRAGHRILPNECPDTPNPSDRREKTFLSKTFILRRDAWMRFSSQLHYDTGRSIASKAKEVLK